MKRITALCVALGVITSSSVRAENSLTFLYGEWFGPGKTSGLAASIRHAWEPALDGQFTSLKLHNQMTGKDGQEFVFEGIGYYRETDDRTFKGFWIDNGGDALPLIATLDNQTLTAIWGSEDTKSGRSVYRLLPDGTLQAVNSVKTENGEWQEFGRSILSRSPTNEESNPMARVTGIGGVFLKSRGDAAALASWYRKHLGMSLEDFGGSILKWEEDTAEDNGITVWHVAESNSEWFSPSDSTFMINYRVDDLEAMLEQFRLSGIDILQGPEYHENGVFAWIVDPDGNKVELWEPKNWDDANKK